MQERFPDPIARKNGEYIPTCACASDDARHAREQVYLYLSGPGCAYPGVARIHAAPTVLSVRTLNVNLLSSFRP